ncbi:MAG: acyltransferase family protein [Promethearchaeota archaeon]|jgi:hypothetical protein
MQRIKSLDTFRGLIIALMVWSHACEWWLSPSSQWFFQVSYLFMDRIFGPGFLFISGISTTLYVKNKFSKLNLTKDVNKKVIRHEYFIRALILLAVALIYNSFVALLYNDFLNIWKWFVLLTLSISLIVSWPILRKSKMLRIFIAIIIWIFNYYIFSFLSLYENQSNINGLIFYIFYNSTDLEPILASFGFFLIGTVMGDFLLEKKMIKKKLRLDNTICFPFLLSGLSLIVIGILFNYPFSFSITSFSWIVFTLGVNISTLSIFIFFEEFIKFQRKKNKWFLYYFSYYSLTIYLTHSILYYLFLNMLNIVSFFFTIIPILIGIGLILRIIHKTKLRRDLSIKTQIGKISIILAKMLDN